MISFFAVNRQGEGLQSLPEKINPAKEYPISWLDIQEATWEEFQLLENPFHFHQLAIEDCRELSHRPKVDNYGSYLFLILYLPGQPTGKSSIPGVELDIFLGPNYIVTYHRTPFPLLTRLKQRYQEDPSLLPSSALELFYIIVEGMVDLYFPLLEEYRSKLTQMEEELLIDPDKELLQDLFAYRRRISSLRRLITPQHEVFNRLLRQDSEFFPREKRFKLMDLEDEWQRVLAMAEANMELVNTALEVFLSSSSNRMNEIMKVLTIIATIMMPLTLFTGIYGMNFTYMPLLESPHGFAVSVIIMLLVAGGMVYYFRKRHWL